jgi:hypothetical protein
MVAFSKLWNSYPKDKSPCRSNGSSNFTNQCAIRLGVCLEAAGVNTEKLNVTRCWYHPKLDGHILRAEELAKVLSSVPGVGRVQKYKKGPEGFYAIENRTGIVLFQNYWGSGSQGDHIDLWNRKMLTRDLRLSGRYQPGDGGLYEKANIWFWPVA